MGSIKLFASHLTGVSDLSNKQAIVTFVIWLIYKFSIAFAVATFIYFIIKLIVFQNYHLLSYFVNN